MFQPWGSYEVLSTDYSSYSIVHSCSGYLASALKLEFLWVLTREPLVPGSAEFNRIQEKTFAIIREKLPEFDLESLRITAQGASCKYFYETVPPPEL